MRRSSFEKLLFWDEIRILVKDVYSVTGSFPENEKSGLMSQMRRSSISISSNIAKETSRVNPKYQAHFSQIAFSRMMELLSQTIVSVKLNALRKSQLVRIKQ